MSIKLELPSTREEIQYTLITGLEGNRVYQNAVNKSTFVFESSADDSSVYLVHDGEFFTFSDCHNAEEWASDRGIPDVWDKTNYTFVIGIK